MVTFQVACITCTNSGIRLNTNPYLVLIDSVPNNAVLPGETGRKETTMKKFTGYYDTIKVDGETYTVAIVAKGTGNKTIYFSYLFGESGIGKEMSGFPIDQRQAKKPHVYTAEEVMEMAMYESGNFIGDIERHNQLEDMLFGFLAEVDENRRIAKELETRTDFD